MSADLTKQKVILTGITGGIAQATAQRLLSLGAELVVTARTEEKLKAATAPLKGQVQGHVVDLLVPEQIEDFFGTVGSFDHLVTPAATGVFSPLLDLDLAKARELLESKQWGQLLCVLHGSKQITKNGSITLFSGTISEKPFPGGSMYAAVGAATEAAGRVWGLELAPIRVNTVVPGVIDTKIWSELVGEEAAKETLSQMASILPVGRVGTPDDIAKAVVFLIDNDFVNGASLVVDGGHRLI